MILVTILVPSEYGNVDDEDKHFMLESKIARLFGGVSVDSRGWFGYRGVWMDRGTAKLVVDSNVRYTVACNLIADGPKLLEIISHIKTEFNQEAVYLEYLGHAEIQ